MDPVLIVGAGPTGLVMALSLARRGVPVRIVDKKNGPIEESRAMGLHARTLEFYRQFGFGDEVVGRGVIADTVHFRAGDRDVARFRLADMGAGLSPYPFMLAFPQDEHERFLLGKLADIGVDVDWGASLVGLTDELSEGGQALRLCGASEILREVLDLTGLADLFEHYLDVNSAVRSFL